jgi:ORF6N domain
MPEQPIPSAASNLPVPIKLIERKIYVIRGQRAMLDSDLAELYGVTTGNLNLAVRRNQQRFPADFMFQLTKEETFLLLQIARAKKGRGGRQTSPYAFTELGVAMLSSVLNSERAVQMNILIMRAFVKLREMLATHQELAARIEKLETGQRDHALAISLVAQDVENLARSVKREFKKARSPSRQKPRIGFHIPGA